MRFSWFPFCVSHSPFPHSRTPSPSRADFLTLLCFCFCFFALLCSWLSAVLLFPYQHTHLGAGRYGERVDHSGE
jgi:hypothetical protein